MKLFFSTVCGAIALLMIQLPSVATGQVEVVPENSSAGSLDFGCVPNDTVCLFKAFSNTTNDDIDVELEIVDDTSGGQFFFGFTESQEYPFLTLPANDAIDVQVCFAFLGETLSQSATLNVRDVSSGDLLATVELFTDCGEPDNPSDLVDSILAFFDQSVADGTLVGSGPCSDRRLRAMRHRIKTIGYLVDHGYENWARFVTYSAILRSDGEPCPRDFIKDGLPTEDGSSPTEDINSDLSLLLVLLGG